jgi:hypothetical protein
VAEMGKISARYEAYNAGAGGRAAAAGKNQQQEIVFADADLDSTLLTKRVQSLQSEMAAIKALLSGMGIALPQSAASAAASGGH